MGMYSHMIIANKLRGMDPPKYLNQCGDLKISVLSVIIKLMCAGTDEWHDMSLIFSRWIESRSIIETSDLCITKYSGKDGYMIKLNTNHPVIQNEMKLRQQENYDSIRENNKSEDTTDNQSAILRDLGPRA